MKKNTMMKTFITMLFLIAPAAYAGDPVVGWNVDCNNHCSFSEFSNNCQGVYYYYPDKTKSYAYWSSQYNACMENAPLQANMHIIAPNLIQCGCPTPSVYPPSENAPITNASRNQLEILRAQIHEWAVCTPDPAGTYANLFKPYSYKNLNTCRYFRKRNLEHNWFTPGGCYKGLNGWDDTDSWHACGSPGDAISNQIINCFSGDNESCKDIKSAFDPITGHWYRNQFDRLHPETSVGQSLSSRDVLMGILVYIAKSQDKAAMTKYLSMIHDNPKAPPLNLWSVCPPRPSVPKPPQVAQDKWDAALPDDRCGLVPEAAGLIYKTAIGIGMSNAEIQTAAGTSFYSALTSGSTTTFPAMIASAASAPATGGPAYQLGNVADGILLSWLIGETGNSGLAGAASTINNRTAKLNPEYHWMAKGRTPTEYGVYLINKYCKPPRPAWGVNFSSGYHHYDNNTGAWSTGEPYHLSAYQYLGGFGPYAQKILPGGQECISWINMYLGNSNVMEAKCNGNDPLINGACLKYAFTPPKLAPVPGIGYKYRMADSKLIYVSPDLNKCPYGGTLEVSTQWPDYFMCAQPSGVPTNWNVQYLVDPDDNGPMIYYNKTAQGTCPWGGTPNGSRCVVQSFATSSLRQSVRYWVDPNPSWPGVYYQKVNNACPYGGSAAGPNCQLIGFGSGFLDPNVTYFTRANPAYPGVFYYPSTVAAETKIIKPVPTGAVDMATVGHLGGALQDPPVKQPKKYIPAPPAVATPFPTSTPVPTSSPVPTLPPPDTGTGSGKGFKSFFKGGN